jgi:hypothetical protein
VRRSYWKIAAHTVQSSEWQKKLSVSTTDKGYLKERKKMDNHSRNNNNKPIQKSNKAVVERNNGNSVSSKSQSNHSAVSQSVGMHNMVTKTAPRQMTNAPVKKKTGSVVGMNRNRQSSLRAVRNPNIITIRKKERSPFPIAVVFTSIIITALLLFMMMNYAEIDKYNSSMNELNSKLTELKDEQEKLSVKLDKKDNLVDIEKYATEKLGMVKAETLEPHYVHTLQPDKSEIIKYDDGQEGGFGFLLAGVGEVINDFIQK